MRGVGGHDHGLPLIVGESDRRGCCFDPRRDFGIIVAAHRPVGIRGISVIILVMRVGNGNRGVVIVGIVIIWLSGRRHFHMRGRRTGRRARVSGGIGLRYGGRFAHRGGRFRRLFGRRHRRIIGKNIAANQKKYANDHGKNNETISDFQI